VYWLSEYIHFYSLHIISTIVFIITGFIFKLQFFTLTSPGVYLLLFFLWGHVQILLAFLFSSLFQRSRYALLVGFLLVVIGVIINIATTGLCTYFYLIIGSQTNVVFFLIRHDRAGTAGLLHLAAVCVLPRHWPDQLGLVHAGPGQLQL